MEFSSGRRCVAFWTLGGFCSQVWLVWSKRVPAHKRTATNHGLRVSCLQQLLIQTKHVGFRASVN